MTKLMFVLKACRVHKANSLREKRFWEQQYDTYYNGVRDGRMHDYTLAVLSRDFLVA